MSENEKPKNFPDGNNPPSTEKKTRTRSAKQTVDATSLSHVPTKRDYGIIAKMFEDEPKEVQQKLIATSGMLQVIKLNISEQSVVIIYLTKKACQPMQEADILDNLQNGAIILNHAASLPGDDLPSFLTSLSDFVTALPDVSWNAFWDGMFKSLAAPYCDWTKLMSYAPYVYNVLVKPVVK